MPRKDATGNAFELRGRWYARTCIGPKMRHTTPLPWAPAGGAGEAPARERAALLARLAGSLRASGDKSHAELVPKLLDLAAEASDTKTLREIEDTVGRLVGGSMRVKAPPVASATFGEVARLWTTGELARRFPHHVKDKKTSAIDGQRLAKHVLPLFREQPISTFTIDHAEQVMASLPAELRPASRRHVAQVLARVLRLAVFPLRLIPASPIPEGWMPRVPKGSQLKQEMPYPHEVDAFAASSDVPLEIRLFVGFVAREGMRHDEAESLTWGDIDLARGLVRLVENKTDDPRSWALRVDTVRALSRWYEMRRRPAPGALVFVDAEGAPLRLLPKTYRRLLRVAGVERLELFEGSAKTKATAIHGLRSCFVTEALARGASETWVADRTGHRTSAMINTYRRRARSFRETSMPGFGPLDALLGVFVGPRAPFDRAAERAAPFDSAAHETPESSYDSARFRCVESNHGSRIQSPLSCL